MRLLKAMSTARSKAGCARFLTLILFAAAPGAIAAVASLGDDPLEPDDTCLSEDDRALRIQDVLRQAEAGLATIQKLGQQRASRVPALRAQIAAVQFQHIEDVQEHIGRALPAKHGAHAVEIGDAVVVVSGDCLNWNGPRPMADPSGHRPGIECNSGSSRVVN